MSFLLFLLFSFSPFVIVDANQRRGGALQQGGTGELRGKGSSSVVGRLTVHLIVPSCFL